MAKTAYIRSADSKAELSRFLNLLRALVVRDFKGQYRRSILGPSWAIIQPVAYMAIFLFLRGLFDIPSEGIPYVIFTYSALVPWAFFANAVTRSVPSVYSNAALVKKMAIPREIFPIAAIVLSLVDLFISSLLLVAMMVWFGVPIGLSLLWVPILVLLTILLALGLGLALAALGTYRRDVIFAVPFLMQFWLLATPIMYPLSAVPQAWQFLYSLNPMVGIIEGFRGAIVLGAAPDLGLLALSMFGIIAVWLVAWPLFRYMSRYFADVL